MAGSIIENEMRNTVIDKLRALRPDSRIIHELNTAGTGSARADLACIGKSEILLFEIKSERDTLKRLTSQWEAFSRASHRTILVLDRKFFPDLNILSPHLHLDLKNCRSENIWLYPEKYHWNLNVRGYGLNFLPTPELKPTLNMLWREELLTLCNNLNVKYLSKDNMLTLVERIILNCTGRDIIEQVCSALRTRKFAKAD